MQPEADDLGSMSFPAQSTGPIEYDPHDAPSPLICISFESGPSASITASQTAYAEPLDQAAGLNGASYSVELDQCFPSEHDPLSPLDLFPATASELSRSSQGMDPHTLMAGREGRVMEEGKEPPTPQWIP